MAAEDDPVTVGSHALKNTQIVSVISSLCVISAITHCRRVSVFFRRAISPDGGP
jgi:hypothetical protein